MKTYYPLTIIFAMTLNFVFGQLKKLDSSEVAKLPYREDNVVNLYDQPGTMINTDTITNWQVYLGDYKILSDNQLDLNSNGVKVVKVKMVDLNANKYLTVNFNTCTKSISRNVEIQFGNGKDRYSQNYYKDDNLKIKTSFIIELIKNNRTKQIVLSLNRPPFTQPNGTQYGLLLVDLRVE